MVTNIHEILPGKILFIYNAFSENLKKSVRVVQELIP